MRKILFFLFAFICIITTIKAQSSTDFVTKWNISGGSNNFRIFRQSTSTSSLNFTWTATNGQSGSGTISGSTSYASAIVFLSPAITSNTELTLRISSTSQLLRFSPSNTTGTGADKDKMIDLMQWGDVAWSSMSTMFYGCSNLQISASDTPNFSNVTDLSYMFNGASVFNQDISSWNTSSVTNMSYMFYGATVFNQNIGGWNTSNVTNMSYLFFSASSFNQNISSWNTTSVSDMSRMFANASVFNQNISSWNTSSVTNMEAMFGSAFAFNQNISSWNFTSVSNMISMFRNASAFNQNLGSWVLRPTGVNLTTMLENSGLSCANYSNTLFDWAKNTNTPPNVVFGASGLRYGTNATSARNFLSSTKSWTINDSGVNSGVCCVIPTITSQLVNQKVSEGSIAQFSIVATGSNLTYQWERSTNNGSTWSTIFGATSAFLTIPGVTLSMNNYQYRVVINSYGCSITSNTALLIIADPSYFETKWRMTSGTTTFNFRIQSTSTASLSYSYYASNGQTGSGTFNGSTVHGTRSITLSSAISSHTEVTFRIMSTSQLRRFSPAVAADLREVSQWGDVAWGSMKEMFYNCNNFEITATDIPNISNVTDMSYMFNNAFTFNHDISSWNTAAVTNMSYMFSFATSFNQNLGNWKLNNSVNMANMLDYSGMDCINYSETLIGWATNNFPPSYRTLGAVGLQYGTNAVNERDFLLNSRLWTIVDAGSSGLVCGCTIPIISEHPNSQFIDIGNDATFSVSATGVNLTYEWQVSTDAGFNWSNISGETTNTLVLNNVQYTQNNNYYRAIVKNGNCQIVSYGAILTTPDPADFVTKWNLASGTSIIRILRQSTNTGNLVFNWSATNGQSGSGTFAGSTTYAAVTINLSTALTSETVLTLRITSTSQLLRFSPSNASGTGADRTKIIDVQQWGNVAWSSMSTMFYNCTNLQISAIDNPNLTNVLDMSSMFRGATSFNSSIGAWNTGSVTTMANMFQSASTFNQNIGSWNTAAVTNMSNMFNSAIAFNQNIGSWNTSLVSNLSNMFLGAAAFNQNIGSWNTANVTNMINMFFGAAAFNKNIGSWNTANVTNMFSMFFNAIAFNQDIGSWNTAAVSNLSGMFSGATAFNQNLGSWNLKSTVVLTNMLNSTAMSCYNYSATLIGWANNPTVPSGRTLGATGRLYGTNAITARDYLVVTKGWTITDGGSSGTVCSACTSPSNTLTISETSGTTNDDGTICSGASVTITASTSETYSWSNGATTQAITIRPISTTLYTVSLANASCTATGNQTITVNYPTLSTSLIADDYVWTGSQDTSWNNLQNWIRWNGVAYIFPVEIPNGSTTNVFLPTSTIDGGTCVNNEAQIGNISISVNNLIGSTGHTFKLNNANSTLIIYGAFEGGNWVQPVEGATVTYNASGNQTIHSGVYTNLAINGTGIKTLAGNTSVLSQLTLTNSDLDLSTFKLELAGSIPTLNARQIKADRGEVSFLNTSEWSLPSTLFENNTTKNLSINGAGGIVLNAPLKVSNQLQLVSGNITSSATNLLEIGTAINETGSIIWNEASNTRIIGPMKRWYGTSASSDAIKGIFPVGTSTHNRMVQVNFLQASSGGYLMVEFIDGLPGNMYELPISYVENGSNKFIQNTDETGYWSITPYDENNQAYAALDNVSYSIKLRINNPNAVENGNTLPDPPTMRIIRAKGNPASLEHGDWSMGTVSASISAVTESTGSNFDYLVEAPSMVGFSWFNVGGDNSTPLPVELLSFSGSCHDFGNLFSWKTASENNSAYFEIQQSRNGENWNVVGQKQAAGFSNEELSYEFLDVNRKNEISYYRLNQVDIDGNNKLYDPIALNCSSTENIAFTYPNPSDEAFNFLIQNQELVGQAEIEIMDSKGTIIKVLKVKIEEGLNQLIINENLASGMYYLTVFNDLTRSKVLKHTIR